MEKQKITSQKGKRALLYAIGIIILYFLINFLITSGVINDYQTQIIVSIGINVILAVSLNLILGFTGQLSLGHLGYMSVGAYTATIATTHYHLPFFLALLLGAAMAGIVGAIIGYPILRLKGDYLAICTLGFGQIVMVFIQNSDFLGGARGLYGIEQKTNFTWVFFGAVFTILVVRNILRSSQGRAMISIREDEIAAESMGINTTKYKLLAFAIGALFAGFAGGLYAHFYYTIQPTSFDFIKSLDVLIFVVFGGMGSLTGSVIAAIVLTILPEALRFLSDYRMVLYPVLLIILMIFRPQGLFGTMELTDVLKFGNLKSKGVNKDGVAKSK